MSSMNRDDAHPLIRFGEIPDLFTPTTSGALAPVGAPPEQRLPTPVDNREYYSQLPGDAQIVNTDADMAEARFFTGTDLSIPMSPFKGLKEFLLPTRVLAKLGKMINSGMRISRENHDSATEHIVALNGSALIPTTRIDAQAIEETKGLKPLSEASADQPTDPEDSSGKSSPSSSLTMLTTDISSYSAPRPKNPTKAMYDFIEFVHEIRNTRPQLVSRMSKPNHMAVKKLLTELITSSKEYQHMRHTHLAKVLPALTNLCFVPSDAEIDANEAFASVAYQRQFERNATDKYDREHPWLLNWFGPKVRPRAFEAD